MNRAGHRRRWPAPTSTSASIPRLAEGPNTALAGSCSGLLPQRWSEFKLGHLVALRCSRLATLQSRGAEHAKAVLITLAIHTRHRISRSDLSKRDSQSARRPPGCVAGLPRLACGRVNRSQCPGRTVGPAHEGDLAGASVGSRSHYHRPAAPRHLPAQAASLSSESTT